MIYASLFAFALLPSLIWLFYYLRKDVHPEPKYLIITVFVAGGISAAMGYFFQKEASGIITSLGNSFPDILFLWSFLQGFLVVAFSEELLKYLSFALPMRGHSELDEPMDFVVYMITAAMGFAAAENLLLFFSLSPETLLPDIAYTSFIRFISAVFLHALASGILGVFIAYSWRFSRKDILLGGLLFATSFHGLYNFLVPKIDTLFYFVSFAALLFAMALCLSLGIKKLRKMKSICV